MISPEVLRRYPFFGTLSARQLKKIAMISEEIGVAKGETLFEESQPAELLFILQEGSIDLFFVSQEEFRSEVRKELAVGEINPGEVVGISGLLAPYFFTATARAGQNCRLIKIDAQALRKLCEQDLQLDCLLVHRAAIVLKERLLSTRIQLAASWAK